VVAGNAEAHGEAPERRGLVHQPERGHAGADLREHGPRVVGGGVGQDQRVLLAAVARGEIAGAPELGLQHARHLHQHLVAAGMPVAVVVGLEVVEVAHHQRQRFAAAARAQPFLAQTGVEAAAVRQARQAVLAAQALEFVVGLAQFLGALRDLLLQFVVRHLHFAKRRAQAPGHVVEGLREPVEFAIRRARQRRVEIALGDGLGRRLDPAHGMRDEARHQQRQAERQHQQGSARGERDAQVGR
jgi:hypothetical protein